MEKSKSWCMSHMIFVHAEVDEAVKLSAERLLEAQGYVPAEAIRLFYQEIVARNGLPFSTSADEGGAAVVPAYEEIRAVGIPSVLAEVSERTVQGDDMLSKLLDYKARRAARKAARKLKVGKSTAA